MKKITKVLLGLVFGLALSLNSYGQESIYVLADINAYPSPPINSYTVSGPALIFQAQQTVPYAGWGPVNLTMDETNGVIFVCYEQSNIINMLDAVTMQYLAQTTAPGAYNLSGLAFDQANSKLYALDRGTNKFYSWTWTYAGYVLTNDFAAPGYINLDGLGSSYDIAVDHINGVLYCGDVGNNAIQYYAIPGFTHTGGYNIGHAPTGIDIDISNQIVYTTGGWFGSTTVSKYDIATSTETMLPTGGSSPIGIAVNQSSGDIYLTFTNGGPYQDNLAVMTPAGTITWNTTANLGDPTGLIYTGQGYNPIGLTVSTAAPCYYIGQNINYTISYSNANSNAVNGVILTDTLPANVSFVSATGNPTVVGNTITWNVGTLAAGAGGSYELICTVNSGSTVDDIATINSNETGLVIVNQQTSECSLPPGVPVSNWALVFGVFLISIFIVVRYRRNLA